MILGLATRDKDVPLTTRKAAEGLYVVVNAYEGRYEYFESDDSLSDDTSSRLVQVRQSQDQIDRTSNAKKLEE